MCDRGSGKKSFASGTRMVYNESMIKIISSPLSRHELVSIAQEGFGDFIKGVVDIERKVVAIGGELHADEEALLLSQGSKQENVWGVNLYPEKSVDEWIEYNSMINVRPLQSNRTRGVEDTAIREKIITIVNALFT